MANNNANMGWGDREEVPNEAENDALAQRARIRTDGTAAAREARRRPRR